MEPLLRRCVLRSLLLAFAASAAIYCLGLGLTVIHEEAEISPHAVVLVAVWMWPGTFLLSLAIFLAKHAAARKL